MAVLHLQLEIDSEVHPELHDMLCSIGGSVPQAERLRQLAAMGLVWERLRLQAYGRIDVPDLTLEPAPASHDVASLPGRVAAHARSGPRVDAAPQRTEPGGFVDLGDAVIRSHPASPEPEHMDDRASDHHHPRDDAAREDTVERAKPDAAAQWLSRVVATGPLSPHELRSAVPVLPVLTEVVAAAELPNIDATATTATAASPAAAHAGSGGTTPAGAQIHDLTPTRKTTTRSRLMRMKEKGLFKNE